MAVVVDPDNIAVGEPEKGDGAEDERELHFCGVLDAVFGGL